MQNTLIKAMTTIVISLAALHAFGNEVRCSSIFNSQSIFTSHIVAIAENNVMGINNEMPWGLALKGDLKRFQTLTSGHIVIMGRKTFESIGRVLPKRHSIVITRNKESVPKHPSVTAVESIDEAMQVAEQISGQYSPEVFVIGGGEIFNQTFSQAKRIYLTLVRRVYQGTVTYPLIPFEKYKVLDRVDIDDEIPYSFINLEKID